MALLAVLPLLLPRVGTPTDIAALAILALLGAGVDGYVRTLTAPSAGRSRAWLGPLVASAPLLLLFGLLAAPFAPSLPQGTAPLLLVVALLLGCAACARVWPDCWAVPLAQGCGCLLLAELFCAWARVPPDGWTLAAVFAIGCLPKAASRVRELGAQAQADREAERGAVRLVPLMAAEIWLASFTALAAGAALAASSLGASGPSGAGDAAMLPAPFALVALFSHWHHARRPVAAARRPAPVDRLTLGSAILWGLTVTFVTEFGGPAW